MAVTSVKTGTIELTIPPMPLLVPAEAMAVVAAIERDYMELALQYLAGQVAEKAPKNFGLLGQSFTANPASSTGGIEILTGGSVSESLVGRVFSSLPYAIVMEEGRRPGQPISRAGVASIGLWVRRKLQLSGKEAQRVMYAVVWKIRKRGIEAKHFVRAAATASEPKIEGMFREMAAGIAEGLVGKGKRGRR